MTNNKLSPRGESSHVLKTVMEEIEELLVRYDLGAVVVLHTPGHSEFLQRIDPSYSCAYFVDGGVQFNTKRLGISKEQKQNMLKHTANMFKLLADNTGMIAMGMIELSEFIDKQVGAEHGEGKLTPHTPKK